MIAVFISMRVRAGGRDELLAAIRTQAARSREREPGCLRFDVAVDASDPDHVLLYEVYADEAAVAAHRTTPHFAEWAAVRDRLVERREATTTTLIDSAAA